VHTRGARAALHDLRTQLEGGVHRVIASVADRAVDMAKAKTTIRSIAQSIAPKLGARNTIFVRAGDRKSRWFEEGTGLYGPRGAKYPIVARNAPLLKFRIGGRWISKRSVMHPGVHAQHYMRDTANAMRPVFRAAMNDMARVAVQKHNA
jgi:hypothetical protein